MKTTLILALFLVNMSITRSYAAGVPPVLVLTNYTFSAGNNTVGKVFIPGREGAIQKLVLGGRDALKFTVNGKNELILRRKYNTAAVAEYRIDITASTSSAAVTGSFRIVNKQFLSNRVIAHRGAWKNTGAPENSIAALGHAIRLGCEGSEFDVHMSADSVLFINHDAAIQGVPIEKTNSSQLSTLKLTNNEPFPTLRAYLDAGTNQYRTKLILEIKPSAISKPRGLALATAVVALVREMKAQAWVDYISFDYDICLQVKALDPSAKVSYLNGDKSPEALANDGLYGLDYHYSMYQKNPAWIGDALQRKLTVNAWTVNDAELMKWLLREKVNFITTNEPELLLSLIAENGTGKH